MRFSSLGLKARAIAQALLFALSIFALPSIGQGSEAARIIAPDLQSFSFRQLEFPFVPDPSMTEGMLCTRRDRDFDRLRYEEQIFYCKRNVSRETKSDIYRAYGVPTRCQKEYTIDHFIPLSIGGNNSVKNLWPEHKSIKALRQHLEENLYKQISQGRITQEEAVRVITEAKWNPPVRNPENFSFCD